MVDHAEHLRLIGFVMSRFSVRKRLQPHDADDVEQQLYLVLRRCGERYNGEFKFSTYVVKSMALYLQTQGLRTGNSRRRQRQRTHRSGERTGEIDVWFVRMLLFSEIGRRFAHDSPVFATEPSAADVAACREPQHDLLRACWEALRGHVQGRRVLRMRFGIGREPHTLDEAGRVLGITRERVRQIEARAILALRNADALKPFAPSSAG